MHAPARTIDGAEVLWWADVRGLTKTNACTFRADGQVQEAFAGLVIAQYVGHPDCYLFLCDENWDTQNDTLHFNVEEAKDFAESIYPGVRMRWQAVWRG